MDALLENMFPALRRRHQAGARADAPPAGQPPPQAPPPPPPQPPPRPAGAQNAAEEQFVAIRDRLFHAMFVRLSLAYARLFSPRVRRMVEFASLLVAICSLAMLTYIHVAFSHMPNHCLDSVKDEWPRDGILRVEIIRDPGEEYTLAKSYEKEERLKLRDPDSLLLSTLEELLDGDRRNREKQKSEEAGSETATEQPLTEVSGTESLIEDVTVPTDPANIYSNATAGSARSTSSPLSPTPSDSPEPGGTEEAAPADSQQTSGDGPDDPAEANSTDSAPPPVTEGSSNSESGGLDQDVTGLERLIRTVWPDEEYIVEYSLEYGLLRLSPATRRRLSVPTQIVLLDPDSDVCFGDHLSRLILAWLIGYDDILLSSIKELAEAEDNRGYLRNVVTGEHYRFVSNWPTSTSFFAACFIMIIFTLTVSMLLRYSHQQIFLFIVDLLQMLEANTIAHFPAAPLLTVILALVGMEAVMSEFFNDSTTAFYVILMVWLVDQYDAVCCHTAISRKHFLRFFFLYHYCFYAYHYRFNGQYSSLALITSWLFIQHAMFYFFHHYELPVILRNAQIQRLVTHAIRRDNQRRAGGQPAAGGGVPEEVLLAMMDAPDPPAGAAAAAPTAAAPARDAPTAGAAAAAVPPAGAAATSSPAEAPVTSPSTGAAASAATDPPAGGVATSQSAGVAAAAASAVSEPVATPVSDPTLGAAVAASPAASTAPAAPVGDSAPPPAAAAAEPAAAETGSSSTDRSTAPSAGAASAATTESGHTEPA
ncbi:Membralin [Amphibalanus amphitrite]|uniref:Membralin n=1 Tax=Amphibalanus amphitrite TaxID=1232801 RepID=A0A6A4X416_AMPAM|nr:Membralin [Amphibalanus amphitrite]